MTDAPRIYVACLAAYNNGRLHGRWIDAAQDVDDIWKEINEMLAASPIPGAEEWAIHDYEGFHPWSLSEYESIERVAAVGRAIEDKGEAVAAFLSNDDSPAKDGDYNELIEAFNESFCGEWDSFRAYCEEDLVPELGIPTVGYVFPQQRNPYAYPQEDQKWGDVLDELSMYLDWDAISSMYEQDYFTVDSSSHTVYIFRSY